MKIRNGFVSNSSSSSFVIYGKCFDDLSKFKLNENQKKLLDDGYEYDLLEDLIPYSSELESHIPYSVEDGVFIGIKWDKIKDDETGLEFKNRVLNLINEKLGTDLKISDLKTYEETYYN